ncbi:hypothetical protein DL765_008224 [Monosporascus sp. GIB2]|nr:hypothetical protein DL765_008224 [Monosporascus sp. GIB2]
MPDSPPSQRSPATPPVSMSNSRLDVPKSRSYLTRRRRQSNEKEPDSALEKPKQSENEPPNDGSRDVGAIAFSGRRDIESQSEMVRRKSGELVRPQHRLASQRRPNTTPGTPVSAVAGKNRDYGSDGEYPFSRRVGYNHRPFRFEIVPTNSPIQSPSRKEQTLWLERIWLSADSKTCLHGSVAVANLAFQKSVVCRFSLDYWRTVAEVRAEYVSEIQGSAIAGYDRFTFSIKLYDQLNLQSKTMYLCIRCTMNNQEYWDNNDGRNYQVDFKKVVLPANDSGVPEKGTTGRLPRDKSPLSDRPRSLHSLTSSLQFPPASQTDGQVPREYGRSPDFRADRSVLPSVDPMSTRQNSIGPGPLPRRQSQDGDEHTEDHDSISVGSSEPFSSDKPSHTGATSLELGEAASKEPTATDQRSPVTSYRYLPPITESKAEEEDIQSIISIPDDKPQDGDKHSDDHDSISVGSSEPSSLDKSSHTGATSLELSEAASKEPTATDQRLPVTLRRYSLPITESQSEEEDIQSIISIPDDIASLAESNSSLKPAHLQAAIEYLVKTLIGDAELLDMYKECVARLGEDKFVRNNRRLLKSYFLGLREEGQTPAQKLAIGLLRRRNHRVNISREIYKVVAPPYIEILPEVVAMLSKERDKLVLLDRFLAQTDAETAAVPGTDQDEGVLRAPDETCEASDLSDDDDSIDGDNEEGIQGVDRELSNLSSAASFLTGGKPYSSYKDGLRRFLDSGSPNCRPEAPTPKPPLSSESPDAKATTPGETIGPVGPNGMDDEEHTQAEKDATKKPGFKNLQPSSRHFVPQIQPVGPNGMDDEENVQAEKDLNEKPGLRNLQLSTVTTRSPSTSTTVSASAQVHPSAFQDIELQQGQSQTLSDPLPALATGPSCSIVQPEATNSHPKFLALCVNTGSYKTLAEIDTSGINSDATGFLRMKEAYLRCRGSLSRLHFLLKPVRVEFVQSVTGRIQFLRPTESTTNMFHDPYGPFFQCHLNYSSIFWSMAKAIST